MTTGGSARLGAFVEVTVASRDRSAAVDFCRRGFELDLLAADAASSLLGAEGVDHGRLRLVDAAADPAVERPQPWELGGRVVGIRPRDVEASRRRLLDAGAAPTAIVGYDSAPGNTTLEYWVDGPDDVTWEVPLSPRMRSPALEADPARGHGELMAAVVATAALDDALELFAEAGGMRLLGEGVFAGEAFATLFGIPPEASVRAAVLRGADDEGMLLELWEFVGVEPVRGPQRPVGLQRLTFAASETAALGERLVQAGAQRLSGDVYRALGVELELLDSRLEERPRGAEVTHSSLHA